MFASPSCEKQIKPSVIAVKSDGGLKVSQRCNINRDGNKTLLCVDEAATAASPLSGSPEGARREKERRAPRLQVPSPPVSGCWDFTEFSLQPADPRGAPFIRVERWRNSFLSFLPLWWGCGNHLWPQALPDCFAALQQPYSWEPWQPQSFLSGTMIHRSHATFEL